MLIYCQLDPEEQTSVEIFVKNKDFVDENAFENVVWTMADILSWP